MCPLCCGMWSEADAEVPCLGPGVLDLNESVSATSDYVTEYGCNCRSSGSCG